jgi:nucleoside-specific outer membrane channel protein Tsx
MGILVEVGMRVFKSGFWLVVLCSLLGPPVLAEPFFTSHMANLQLLHGNHYKPNAPTRTIATLEYANSGRYGDFFSFADYSQPTEGDAFYYAEVAPRFSLSKLSGNTLSAGPLKDILLATMLEKPKNKDNRYLYGVGSDWAVPGFTFFKVNYYVRDNPDLAGTTTQLTLSWLSFFTLHHSQWLFEGFADIAGREGTTLSHQLIVPRLLWDASSRLNLKHKTLWFGVEYSYWHNKFGIAGVTESVPQLQIKWVL